MTTLPQHAREVERQPDAAEAQGPRQAFWQWLAIGVLLACWLAEAHLLS